MGIHIHNHCMGCIHQSSWNLQWWLHSQRTSKLRNHVHSSFHHMDDFLHCFHNPSNHIHRSNHHYHHCNHSRTSRSCFRMELMNCIHNLRSNRCMGCIHRSSLNLQCYLHSQRTNRFRNRDRSSFHRMDEFLHCFHNPSNHILRSNHHCHHCIHSRTSRSCFRMELMNCIHNLQSIRCSHCRIQVLRMGIHIHNRCMGCIHRSSLSLQCYLRSQHTSKLHNRDHSSFHRMDEFLHCFHNPSNHILRSNHHYHHCIHSRTSRSCF